jgi:riboflavin synthase
MFTGIVETMGRVVRVAPYDDGARLGIETPKPLAKVRIGESIALSGACMTVVRAAGRRITVDVSPESLRRTTLGALRVGDRVNVERALRMGDRLGGHLVQGHVDGVGTLRAVTPDGRWTLHRFQAPATIARYLVEKGSIAVDGVSLTIFACRGRAFTVAVIPHTLAVTTLGRLRPGDRVNVEADVLMKHVEALLPSRSRRRA